MGSANIMKQSDDVLTRIVFLVPAKQVGKIRCISKLWNDLLCQPSFIKSYLNNSIHNKEDEILLVFPSSRLFTAHSCRSPRLDLSSHIKKLPLNIHTCLLIGSVNGLICFRDYSHNEINIWNPSLSAFISIPPYTRSRSKYDVLFRFGFDPKTDDYKILKLTFLVVQEKNPFGIFSVHKDWLQLEVYSIRKGSWKFITQRFPSHIKKICFQDEVFVDGHDGHLHWLCNIGQDQKLQTILAFDLGSESFYELPLPDFILNVQRRNSLGLLGGKLCVMSSIIAGGECEVWVMDTYGMTESWVKQHVFSFHCGILNPFGFTLHNQFVFEDNEKNLSLFDPLSDKVIPFKTKARRLGYTKIVHYVESLVWVVPPKCGINSSTLQI